MGAALSELADSNISLVNNVFIKQMVFRGIGWTVMTHAHVYDHQTLLSVGALRVTVGAEVTDYQAPTIIVVKAGLHHRMESISDFTVAYCIHAINGSACVDDAESLVMGQSNAALTQLA